MGTYKDEQGKDTTTAKVNLSGDPEITGNTTTTGTGGDTEERNIVLPTDGNDVINTSGLTGGTVGVYVPEELSDGHGSPMTPFGTFNDVDEDGNTIPAEDLGLNHIVNDATGMTGAARTNADNHDEKSIVWMKIVSLTVKKTVLDSQKTGEEQFIFGAYYQDSDESAAYTYTWNDGTDTVSFTEGQAINGQFVLVDMDIVTAPVGTETAHTVKAPAGVQLTMTETMDDAEALSQYASSVVDGHTGLLDDPAPSVSGHTVTFTIDPARTVTTASLTVSNSKNSITINNELIDNMTSSMVEFTYSASVRNANGQPLKNVKVADYVYRDEESGTEIIIPLHTNDNGEIVYINPVSNAEMNQVTISSGKEIVLMLPTGSELTVTQQPAQKYETTVTAEKATNLATANTNRIFTMKVQGDDTITFKNTLIGQKIRIVVMGDDAENGLGGARIGISCPTQDINLTNLVSSGEEADLGLVKSSDISDGVLFVLPFGDSYTIKEITPPNYYDGIGDIIMEATSTALTIKSVGDDAEAPFDGVVLSDTADEDGIRTLTITNRRKWATVTVTKDAIGDRSQTNRNYTYSQTGLQYTQTENGTLEPTGNQFVLYGVDLDTTPDVHENTKTFRVPCGTVINISEIDGVEDSGELRNLVFFDTEAGTASLAGVATGNYTVEGDVTISFTQLNTGKGLAVPVKKTLTLNKNVSELTADEIDQLKKLSFTFNLEGEEANPAGGASFGTRYVLNVGNEWDNAEKKGSVVTFDISKAWSIGFSKPGAYKFEVTEVDPGTSALFTSDTVKTNLTYYVVEEAVKTENGERKSVFRIAEEAELDRSNVEPSVTTPIQGDVDIGKLFNLDYQVWDDKDDGKVEVRSIMAEGVQTGVRMELTQLKCYRTIGAITTKFGFDFSRSFEIDGKMQVAKEDGMCFAFQTNNAVPYKYQEGAYGVDKGKFGTADGSTVQKEYLEFGTQKRKIVTESGMGNGFLFTIFNEPVSGMGSFKMDGLNRTPYSATDWDGEGEKHFEILKYKYNGKTTDVRVADGNIDHRIDHGQPGEAYYDFTQEQPYTVRFDCLDHENGVGTLTITMMGGREFRYENFDAKAMFGEDNWRDVYFVLAAAQDNKSSLSMEITDFSYTDGIITSGVDATFWADRDGDDNYETQVNLTNSPALPGETILVRHELRPAGETDHDYYLKALVTQLVNRNTGKKLVGKNVLTRTVRDSGEETYSVSNSDPAFNSYEPTSAMSIKLFEGSQSTFFEYTITAPNAYNQEVYESALFGLPPFPAAKTQTIGFRTEKEIEKVTPNFGNSASFMKLTYDFANGGTTEDDVLWLLTNTQHSVKAGPTRDGYVFGGWSEGTTVYRPGDNLAMGGNHTLTALWKKRVVVTKTWNEISGVPNANSSIQVVFTGGEGVLAADQTDSRVTADGSNTVTLNKGSGNWPNSWTVAVPVGVNGITERPIPNYVTEVGTVANWNSAPVSVTITNTRAVCMIVDDNGEEHLFTSLKDAMTYVGESSDKTATVQMLVDYTMDKDDALNIPAGYDITLTTADKFDPTSGKSGYVGSDTSDNPQATITRGDDNDKSLITSSGSLTMTDIALDGKNIKTSDNGSLINVSGGSLNLEDGTTLKNAQTSGNGGAIYGNGTITVGADNSGKPTTITGCTADKGAAIYVPDGKELTLDGGNNSSTNGVQITGNTANDPDGGAINVGYTTDSQGNVTSHGTVNVGGNVTIKDNTGTGGSNDSGTPTQKNLVLDVPSSDVIHTTADGLGTNASVGIYATDEVRNDVGIYGKPFASFDPNDPRNNADKFTNDRNGSVKGTSISDSDGKVYWTDLTCKLTTADGLLLYTDANLHQPAVYTSLDDALEDTDTSKKLYYKKTNADGTYTIEEYTGTQPIQVQMLSDVTLDSPINYTKGRDFTITTAPTDRTKNASVEDMYVYTPAPGGDATKAKITNAQNSSSMISVNTENSFTVSDLILDGGSQSVSGNGGAINISKGNVVVENATLQDFSVNGDGTTHGTGNGGLGGAIYVGAEVGDSAKPTLTLKDATITGSSAVNGGGVFVADGATVNMNDSSKSNNTVKGNTATGNGAGIYLEQGSTLNLAGNPDFGGTGTEDATGANLAAAIDHEADNGNYTNGTLTGKTNGQQAYTKPRQDIFIAGYDTAGSAAQSLVLTGALDVKPGSIWIEAGEQEHYEMLKQFAVFDDDAMDKMDANQLANTLQAFRNAQTDDKTGCGADYLTGQLGEDIGSRKCIYWTGGFDVSFLKIDGFGNGLNSAEFTLYTVYNEATSAVSVPVERSGVIMTAVSKNAKLKASDTATTDGVVMFDKIAPKTYYMKETKQPDNYVTDNSLYRLIVSGENNWEISRTAMNDDGTVKKQNGVTVWEEVNKNSGNVYRIMNVPDQSRRVILKKTTDGNKPLEGARFRIFRADLTEYTDGQPVYKTGDTIPTGKDVGDSKGYYESAASGVYFIGTLSYGKYYLVETKAPNGASADNSGKVFILTVNAEGVTVPKDAEWRSTAGTEVGIYNAFMTWAAAR